MRRTNWLALVTSCLFPLAAAAPAGALTLDSFASPPAGQVLLIPLGGGNPASTSSAAAATGDAIGNERDLVITRTAGLTSFAADVNSTTAGAFTHSQGLGVSGISVFTWDGADGDATVLDPLGLGNLDLTVGGSQTGFEIEFLSLSATALLTLEVFTDGLTSSSHSVSVSSPGSLVLDYASFIGTADFGDVGAIRLTLDGSAAPGLSASLGSFATVPEPASALLVGVGLAALALRRRPRA